MPSYQGPCLKKNNLSLPLYLPLLYEGLKAEFLTYCRTLDYVISNCPILLDETKYLLLDPGKE